MLVRLAVIVALSVLTGPLLAKQGSEMILISVDEKNVSFEDRGSQKSPFVLNRLHHFMATLPGTNCTDLKFIADMPEHGHGTLTLPKTSKSGPCQFEIKGLKLHMAGTWRLQFSYLDVDKPIEKVVFANLEHSK